jgi:hypothetical protein
VPHMIVEGIDLIFTPADCTLCLKGRSQIVDPDLFPQGFWDLLLLAIGLLPPLPSCLRGR